MSEKDNITGEEFDAENKELNDDTSNLGGEEDKNKQDGLDEEDEDRPITLKDLKEFRKGVNSEINNRFASRRHDQKDSTKPYKKPEANKENNDDPIVGRLTAIEIANAKRDFGYENNLPPRAVDYVFKFANGKPTSKTLNDPFIKGGLEKLMASMNLRENTPNKSGSNNFTVEGKPFEELDADGKQKNFAAKQQAILANKRR